MDGVGGGSRAFKSVLKEEMGQGPLEKDFENFQEDTPKNSRPSETQGLGQGPNCTCLNMVLLIILGIVTRENLRLSGLDMKLFSKSYVLFFMISHLKEQYLIY